MSYAEWAESFAIFEKYSQHGDPEVYWDYYEIYAGCSPSLMDEADKTRLEQLGWMESSDYDCWARFS